MKTCPYCAEEIKEEATVCRYCGQSVIIHRANPAAFFVIFLVLFALFMTYMTVMGF